MALGWPSDDVELDEEVEAGALYLQRGAVGQSALISSMLSHRQVSRIVMDMQQQVAACPQQAVRLPHIGRPPRLSAPSMLVSMPPRPVARSSKGAVGSGMARAGAVGIRIAGTTDGRATREICEDKHNEWVSTPPRSRKHARTTLKKPQNPNLKNPCRSTSPCTHEQVGSCSPDPCPRSTVGASCCTALHLGCPPHLPA